jgi:hypothetical protein
MLADSTNGFLTQLAKPGQSQTGVAANEQNGWTRHHFAIGTLQKKPVKQLDSTRVEEWDGKVYFQRRLLIVSFPVFTFRTASMAKSGRGGSGFRGEVGSKDRPNSR